MVEEKGNTYVDNEVGELANAYTEIQRRGIGGVNVSSLNTESDESPCS